MNVRLLACMRPRVSMVCVCVCGCAMHVQHVSLIVAEVADRRAAEVWVAKVQILQVLQGTA